MKALLIASAAAALTFASAAAAPQQSPRRVMSLNLCTDQLLLQLLPVERITSVSYLSRASAGPAFSAEAFDVRVNYGSAEEVLRERPDLVVTGTATTATVRTLLRRIGASLVEVPPAENFEQIRAVTRLVARAVGAEAKGEALIAEMDAILSELDHTAPGRRISVAGWNAAGNIPARGTLFDAILAAAGGENVAHRFTANALTGYTAFDLELLAAARPDVLIYSSSRVGRLDLASQQLQHRVVRKLYPNRQIVYPEALYGCGLPQSAAAARDLRRAMLSAVEPEPNVP